MAGTIGYPPRSPMTNGIPNHRWALIITSLNFLFIKNFLFECEKYIMDWISESDKLTHFNVTPKNHGLASKAKIYCDIVENDVNSILGIITWIIATLAYSSSWESYVAFCNLLIETPGTLHNFDKWGRLVLFLIPWSSLKYQWRRLVLYALSICGDAWYFSQFLIEKPGTFHNSEIYFSKKN